MAPRAIYYDTETTGVKADKDRIIEIAFYDATLQKKYCTFIDPKMPIPPESSQISGITDAMVRGAPAFHEVIDAMLEFCSGDAYLIAHNNDAFDFFFLQEEFKRTERQLPEYKYIDTLKWARRYRPDLPKHSLQYLREVYQVGERTAHRALDDVMVLFEIFTHMIGDLPIMTAYELLYSRSFLIRYMPFGKYKGKPLEEIPKHYLKWLMESGALDKQGNQDLKASLAKIT
ncbi:MAG: DNA polymerase III subunit epsilon [Chlamydiae bacterium RIFCSPHIGHO2_12_FULL_49_11]|nr:MAG: DNA polymerase III subunit epsilon [Chlamydiae bacterium RIFCSPHIGHO2_12_FULL_49_11]